LTDTTPNHNIGIWAPIY